MKLPVALLHKATTLLAAAALLWLALVATPAQAACSNGGCLSAGPRLASINTQRGALTNLVLGNLLGGSALTVDVADWNAIASGDISILKTANALQTTLGFSSPTTALGTNTSLLNIVNAAASAANADQKWAVGASLANIATKLNGVSGQIKLSDLIVTDGGLGNSSINALNLVTGAIQLYNKKNVLTTPATLSIDLASLGLGLLGTNLSLAAQVVEAPVFVCGPAGVATAFHTATIRIKLHLDLGVSLEVGLLTALGVTAEVKLTKLDLYTEVAHADGWLDQVNAISGAMVVKVMPGVASLYLGIIDDALFFNRGRAILAADVQPAVIASAKINSIVLSITAKSTASGTSPSTKTLNFSAPYPQMQTAYTTAGFTTNLLNSLVDNLTLTITPSLGFVLDALVIPVLKTVLKLGITDLLGTVVDSLLNPVLELVGVRLGEVDVTVGGFFQVCAVSGSVYSDANHSSTLDAGELGTGATLYAKLVPTGSPTGPAIAWVAVDTTTGAFSFDKVQIGSYTLVVNAANNYSSITPALPSGWLGTENPTFSRSVTFSADLTAQKFGLWHGSRIVGSVFKDTGIGSGGVANNGVRDGTEAVMVGVTVSLTDSAGTTVLDRTTSGDQGGYTLWLPYSAVGTVKVTPQAGADWVATGGSAGNSGGAYVLATETTTWVATSGSDYTGLNFARVPANRFDTDGQQSVQPGQVTFYAHTYTAGTAGVLSFITSAPSTPGWASQLFEDTNCNGKLDDGEPLLSGTRTMVAGQKLCIAVKVLAPVTAAFGTPYPLAVTARLTYANSSIVGDSLRQDLTLVTEGGDGTLRLVKVVDKTSAGIGEIITYTITYMNQGSAPLSALKIIDYTPAYTVLSSASCGATPSAALVCSVSTVPAVGVAGRVEWTFTGTLAGGGSGTVTLQVMLQ